MAATTRAFHTAIRWSTTPEAASAASFQPSNAAITTGRTSSGVSSISITPSSVVPACGKSPSGRDRQLRLVLPRGVATGPAPRGRPATLGEFPRAPSVMEGIGMADTQHWQPDATDELTALLRERIVIL